MHFYNKDSMSSLVWSSRGTFTESNPIPLAVSTTAEGYIGSLVDRLLFLSVLNSHPLLFGVSNVDKFHLVDAGHRFDFKSEEDTLLCLILVRLSNAVIISGFGFSI